MKRYLFAALLSTALVSPLAVANDDDIPGQWVCFAHDYIDGHAKGDPDTEDCIQSYHKGEGICLSHAKSAAKGRCVYYGGNRMINKIDARKNCFRANARPHRG